MKGLELRGNPDHRFKFNGIERVENFELNWDMALFRSYDQILGLWGQSDPKYNYSQSVYSGFGNNPLRYVDPLGDTISIHYGDNQTLQYNQGLKYNGDNAFVSSVVSSLNNLSSTTLGQELLTPLISSQNNFDFTNTYYINKNGDLIKDVLAFREYENGGGEINAAVLTNNESDLQKLGVLSHELFHGYQHENGQSGASIFNEVEAYLFEYSTRWEYINGGKSNLSMFHIPTLEYGRENAYGLKWENAFKNLYNNNFKVEVFQDAVKAFRHGSQQNISGIYNKYLFRRPNQKIALINRFYPLKR